MSEALLSAFRYAYDKEGNIVAWRRRLGSAAAKTETYGYDAADQLIEATLTAGAATERRIAYEYDLAGNRTNERAVVGQLPQTTDYEALEFDAVNRVTAVVKGTRRSEFFYDGLGRRVRMVEREGATPVSDKRYIWDGGEIVEERDGANASVVTKRYFGAGVQEVAANATTNLFYSRDHLGSVREVTDTNGNLVARYDYDAWGRQTQVFGTYRADWGYAGYFVHRASKLNLTWYRAYDADLGRWVSRDPIAEAGGINFYAYVENSPINFTDPLGLIHVARDGRLHDDAKGGLETLCNNKANRARDIGWLQRSIAVRSLENQNFLDAFKAVQAGRAEWLPEKKPYDFWRNYDGHKQRIDDEIETLNRCRARDDDDKCEQTERIMEYFEKKWLEEAFKDMMRQNRQRGASPLPFPFPVPFRIPIPFRR